MWIAFPEEKDAVEPWRWILYKEAPDLVQSRLRSILNFLPECSLQDPSQGTLWIRSYYQMLGK